MLSTKFAKLPNEIIREIAQYAGIKYRNGKYMVQIPKDDPRYHILSQIPPKKIYYEPNNEPNFLVCVTLSRQDNRNNYIYLDVSNIIWSEERMSSTTNDTSVRVYEEYINYNLYVVDKKKLCNRRNYHYREET